MTSLTIRRIDDRAKEALEELALQDGRSVEDYVRNLIYTTIQHKLPVEPKRDLAAKVHGVMTEMRVFLTDDDLPPRNEIPRDVTF